MPTDATFELFEKELNRLVELFGKRLAELKKPGYAEAQLRDDFLNPMFRALGWDMENRADLIQREREVEIESATQIGGGRKRADYLFRADKRDRFVCEAKKPAEELHASYAFQAKRYTLRTECLNDKPATPHCQDGTAGQLFRAKFTPKGAVLGVPGAQKRAAEVCGKRRWHGMTRKTGAKMLA